MVSEGEPAATHRGLVGLRRRRLDDLDAQLCAEFCVKALDLCEDRARDMQPPEASRELFEDVLSSLPEVDEDARVGNQKPCLPLRRHLRHPARREGACLGERNAEDLCRAREADDLTLHGVAHETTEAILTEVVLIQASRLALGGSEAKLPR